jgi:hypothetical protein
MPVLGSARMVVWFELDDPAIVPEHDQWHAQEHMFERLGIPGFLRGRRAVGGTPRRYFVCYDVDALDTLDGADYRRCLNQPTPWTQRMMPHLRNVTRSLCRVTAAAGGGAARALATVRFSPAAGAADALRGALAGELLPALAAARGLTGAQVWESAARAKGQGTAEQALRGSGDGEIDWALLIEGYDPDALRAALDGSVAAALARGGAAPGAVVERFTLDFTLAAGDVRS